MRQPGRSPSRRLRERTIETLLFLAAASSVAVTFAIVFILVSEALPLFREVSLLKFLTDRQWTPLFDDAHFGIMTLIAGTATLIVVAAIAAAMLAIITAPSTHQRWRSP